MELSSWSFFTLTGSWCIPCTSLVVFYNTMMQFLLSNNSSYRLCDFILNTTISVFESMSQRMELLWILEKFRYPLSRWYIVSINYSFVIYVHQLYIDYPVHTNIDYWLYVNDDRSYIFSIITDCMLSLKFVGLVFIVVKQMISHTKT